MPVYGFLILGGLLMAVGMVMLTGWANNKSRWLDAGIFEGQSKKLEFIPTCLYFLYFIVLVLAPLLAGGILIVYALREM